MNVIANVSPAIGALSVTISDKSHPMDSVNCNSLTDSISNCHVIVGQLSGLKLAWKPIGFLNY